jgi:hypothetical protein
MVFNFITQEMKEVVFNVIVDLIKQKGKPNAMVSSYDIVQELRNRDQRGVPRLLVEMIVDVMVTDGTLRYFRTDKFFTYFGISKGVWDKMSKGQLVI